MFHKGLWFQHYKQSKYILWTLWLVATLGGIQLYSHANIVVSNLEYSLISIHKYQFQYYFNVDLDMISMLQLLICIALPAFLVGYSRSNQSLEYIYAMPVKREHIYMSKWMLGIVHIIGASTFGLLLQLAVVHTTILNTYMTDGVFWIYYLHQLFILCAVFSFSLWLGCIGGSFFSQVAFSVIFLLLPYGLFGLVKGTLSLHYFAFGVTDIRDLWFFSQAADHFFQNISFPIKLLNIRQMFSMNTDFQQGAPQEYMELLRQTYYGMMSFVIPLLVTLGSVWGMLRMAVTARNENNGKLLLNNRLRPFLVSGVVICAFLFGGTLLEGMLGNHYYDSKGQHVGRVMENMAIYYVAAVAFAAVAYGVIKKMLGSKLLLRKQ